MSVHGIKTSCRLDGEKDHDLDKSVASILKQLSEIKASQERMEEHFAKIAQPESFAWALDGLQDFSCAEAFEGVTSKSVGLGVESKRLNANEKEEETSNKESCDGQSDGGHDEKAPRRNSNASHQSKASDMLDKEHPLRALTVAFCDEGGAKYLKGTCRKSRARNTVKSVRKLALIHTGNIFERIVYHPAFEVLSAVTIFAHCLIIAGYVESVAINAINTGESKGHPALSIGNQVFVIIFMFEVVIKLGAEGKEYFCGKERLWNLFDIILVTMVVLEVSISVVTSNMDDHRQTVKKMLKIGEIFRTIRVLRILRFLRFSSALRLIIVKIFNSMTTLFWVMVLIFMLLFVIAVCITHGASSYFDGVDVAYLSVEEEKVKTFYGSVTRSFITLFKAVTGGDMWGDMADALMDISVFYALMFVGYIGFTVFAVLNLITGIFVDAALQTALHDRDLIMERQAEAQEASVEHLREVFFEMDEEEDGLIVIDQFREYLKDERVKSYMHALKIDTSDAAQLFRLLDSDNSGEILIDEFVEGCMKLRGEAKSMDIHIMMCENRRMWIKLNCFVHTVTDKIEELHRAVAASLTQAHAGGRHSLLHLLGRGSCHSQHGLISRPAARSPTNGEAVRSPTNGSHAGVLAVRHSPSGKMLSKPNGADNGHAHENAWATSPSSPSREGSLRPPSREGSLRPPGSPSGAPRANDISPPTTHPFGLNVENVDAETFVTPVPTASFGPDTSTLTK